MFRKTRWRALISWALRRRTVVVILLCLVGSLLLAPSSLAYRHPASNMISNPAFETGPGHFAPWSRAGDTRLIIGDESCCAQSRLGH